MSQAGNRSVFTGALLAALIIITSAGLLFAENPTVRETRRSSGISWMTDFSHDGASLRIKVPSGEIRDLPLGAGRSLDLDFGEFQDGLYVYELSFQARAVKPGAEGHDRAGLERQDLEIRLPTYSGAFRILNGLLVLSDQVEERMSGGTAAVSSTDSNPLQDAAEVAKGSVIDDSDAGTRDQQILDDLIVDGSACVGQDCVNGESFGFDTIRLKENNLRIKFQDTSSSASFPTNDWQLTANDSSNGGQNKFSIDDIDGGRTPFTIEASAPSNSLYVDDGGRIGFGTATPVVELHTVDGDTPTLRLEQNGSSGFTPQTWDVASNETNFFVRDATNGSTLPFRIRPGAPTSAIDIAADGDVGIGTSSPGASLHVRGTDGTTQLKIEEASATSTGRILMNLINNGGAQFRLENTVAGVAWKFVNNNGGLFSISDEGDGTEFQMTPDGNVTIAGTLTVRNGQADQATYPDFVFAPDYSLMDLGELSDFVEANRHLPEIPTAETMAREGINMTEMQIKLLQKVEELTIYTIRQQREIEELRLKVAESASE